MALSASVAAATDRRANPYHVVVGGPQAQAVAQVVSIESLPQGDLVHVRPLPGPVSDYGHLLARDLA